MRGTARTALLIMLLALLMVFPLALSQQGGQNPACSSDSDCAEGQQCLNGVCAQPASRCSSDADCPLDGQACINGECIVLIAPQPPPEQPALPPEQPNQTPPEQPPEIQPQQPPPETPRPAGSALPPHGDEICGVLTSDLALDRDVKLTSEETCFFIRGATLDCRGHSLEGPGNGGYAIAIEGSGGVRNCRISGFTDGISVSTSNSTVIENTEVVVKNVALSVYRSWNFTLHNSTLESLESAPTFMLYRSPYATVESSRLKSVDDYAIHISRSNNTVIRNTTMSYLRTLDSAGLRVFDSTITGFGRPGEDSALIKYRERATKDIVLERTYVSGGLTVMDGGEVLGTFHMLPSDRFSVGETIRAITHEKEIFAVADTFESPDGEG